MPQVFNAEFDLRYRGGSSASTGFGGTGRTLQLAIHRAVVRLEGAAPDPGTEIDMSLDLAPGSSAEIHGVVQSCDGDRVALRIPRYTAEVGRVLDAASRKRRV